jgi:hypothetical protein
MQEKDDHLLPPPTPFQHSAPGLLTFRYYSKVFKLISFSTHLGIFFTSIIHSHVCKFVHADNRIIIFGTHTKFRVPTLDINKINGFAPTVTGKPSKDGW